MNNLSSSLSTYPIISNPTSTSIGSLQPSNLNTISISGQDISPALATSIGNSLASTQTSYASTYQLVAGTGVVNQNITSVVTSCVAEPTVNLIRMVGIFNESNRDSPYPWFKS